LALLSRYSRIDAIAALIDVKEFCRIVPGLCWVYAHLCSEIVLVFFGVAPGFPVRSRTTSEQSQQKSKHKPGANPARTQISSSQTLQAKWKMSDYGVS
jgi:hypothetical protein